MAPNPESQLAYLGFRLIAPSRPLHPYVQSYWSIRRDSPLATGREEFMHPRGGLGLIFNLGGSVSLDGRAVAAPVFLDGATTISRKAGLIGQVDLLGIRFHEGGAYPVLGLPLAELRNRIGLLDALEGSDLSDLAGRLHAAATLPDRVGLLEAWLLGRLALGHRRSAIVPASLALLRERAGQVRIPELADELAIGQRQLERLYQSQVGMSPKQYARLLRVEQARLGLKALRGRTAGELAADLGFYDQPHFIREFRAVVGMSPLAYLRRSQSQATQPPSILIGERHPR